MQVGDHRVAVLISGKGSRIPAIAGQIHPGRSGEHWRVKRQSRGAAGGVSPLLQLLIRRDSRLVGRTSDTRQRQENDAEVPHDLVRTNPVPRFPTPGCVDLRVSGWISQTMPGPSKGFVAWEPHGALPGSHIVALEMPGNANLGHFGTFWDVVPTLRSGSRERSPRPSGAPRSRYLSLGAGADLIVGRDAGGDEDVAADGAPFADDGFAAENGGSGVDGDVVPDGGMSLLAAEELAECGGQSAEGDALVDFDVVADFGGFADDDAGAVIDEEASAEAVRRGGCRCR